MLKSVRGQVQDQVLVQVRGQVWFRVEDQVNEKVEEQVWDQVWEQVGSQVRGQVLEFYYIPTPRPTPLDRPSRYVPTGPAPVEGSGHHPWPPEKIP